MCWNESSRASHVAVAGPGGAALPTPLLPAVDWSSWVQGKETKVPPQLEFFFNERPSNAKTLEALREMPGGETPKEGRKVLGRSETKSLNFYGLEDSTVKEEQGPVAMSSDELLGMLGSCVAREEPHPRLSDQVLDKEATPAAKVQSGPVAMSSDELLGMLGCGLVIEEQGPGAMSSDQFLGMSGCGAVAAEQGPVAMSSDQLLGILADAIGCDDKFCDSTTTPTSRRLTSPVIWPADGSLEGATSPGHLRDANGSDELKLVLMNKARGKRLSMYRVMDESIPGKLGLQNLTRRRTRLGDSLRFVSPEEVTLCTARSQLELFGLLGDVSWTHVCLGSAPSQSLLFSLSHSFLFSSLFSFSFALSLSFLFTVSFSVSFSVSVSVSCAFSFSL